MAVNNNNPSKKLGFAFKTISKGSRDPQYINPKVHDCWMREFRPETTILDMDETLNMDDNVSVNVATFLSFKKEGFIISLVAPWVGRKGDCFQGAIYVPCNINLSADEILEAYKKVKEVVEHNNKAQELKKEREDFFKKDYSVNPYPDEYEPSIMPGSSNKSNKSIESNESNKANMTSGSKQWGVIDLSKSGHTLEYLFCRAYQKGFSEYASIYIQEKDSKVSIKEHERSRFADLTDTEFKKNVCVLPPANNPNMPKLLKKEGVKFFLKVGNSSSYEPFDTFKKFNEGTKLSMKATLEGYEDIISDEVSLTLDNHGKYLGFHKKDAKWEKLITPDMFQIQSNLGDDLNQYVTIHIDGNQCSKSGVYVSEDKLAKCKVTVTFKDKYKGTISASDLDKNRSNDKYADHNIVTVSFKKVTEKPKVDLTSSEKVSIEIPFIEYQKRLKVVDGRIPEMKLSRMFDDNEDGLVTTKEKKCSFKDGSLLRWVKRIKSNKKLSYPIIGIIGIIGIGIFFMSDIWGNNSGNQGGSFTDESKEEYGVVSTNISDSVNEAMDSTLAIKYLNNAKGKWHRDSLEKFETTKGLFNALNTYDYDWLFSNKDKLNQSDYNRLMNVVEENNTHIRNLYKDSSTYNKGGDLKINIDNYIKKLQGDNRDSTPYADASKESGTASTFTAKDGMQHPLGTEPLYTP